MKLVATVLFIRCEVTVQFPGQSSTAKRKPQKNYTENCLSVDEIFDKISEIK